MVKVENRCINRIDAFTTSPTQCTKRWTNPRCRLILLVHRKSQTLIRKHKKPFYRTLSVFPPNTPCFLHSIFIISLTFLRRSRCVSSIISFSILSLYIYSFRGTEWTQKIILLMEERWRFITWLKLLRVLLALVSLLFTFTMEPVRCSTLSSEGDSISECTIALIIANVVFLRLLHVSVFLFFIILLFPRFMKWVLDYTFF